MKFTAQKKSLLRVLGRCQGVADKKSTMPILANVLLATTATGVRISATDLFLAVAGDIEAEVAKPGSVAVSARDLFERIRTMPDGDVVCEEKGATVVIKAAGSSRRFTQHALPGDEFPNLPQPEDDALRLAIPADTIAHLIACAGPAISTDDTRAHLNSALVEWSPGLVRMVGTDGHRLAKSEAKVGGLEGAGSMLIPLKGVLELKRLCEEAKGGDVAVAHSKANAFFTAAGFQFSVKLTDGTFPPYQQVIPDTSERVVRAPRLAMADALRAVSVAASDRTGGVKLTLGGGVMRFESENPETGQGFDEIAIEYDGPERTVGLNARYALDALTAPTEDEEVLVGVSGELDPIVFQQASGGEFLAVVMPMRV